MKRWVIRNPGKNYRKVEIMGDGKIVPTLMASDYKSPDLVIEIIDDETANATKSR